MWNSHLFIYLWILFIKQISRTKIKENTYQGNNVSTVEWKNHVSRESFGQLKFNRCHRNVEQFNGEKSYQPNSQNFNIISKKNI
jgi:hypothetical protein